MTQQKSHYRSIAFALVAVLVCLFIFIEQQQQHHHHTGATSLSLSSPEPNDDTAVVAAAATHRSDANTRRSSDSNTRRSSDDDDDDATFNRQTDPPLPPSSSLRRRRNQSDGDHDRGFPTANAANVAETRKHQQTASSSSSSSFRSAGAVVLPPVRQQKHHEVPTMEEQQNNNNNKNNRNRHHDDLPHQSPAPTPAPPASPTVLPFPSSLCVVGRYVPSCHCDRMNNGGWCADKDGISRCTDGECRNIFLRQEILTNDKGCVLCCSIFRFVGPNCPCDPGVKGGICGAEGDGRSRCGGEGGKCLLNVFRRIPRAVPFRVSSSSSVEEMRRVLLLPLPPPTSSAAKNQEWFHKMCRDQEKNATTTMSHLRKHENNDESDGDDDHQQRYWCRTERYPDNSNWKMTNLKKTKKKKNTESSSSPSSPFSFGKHIRIWCVVDQWYGISNTHISLAACLAMAWSLGAAEVALPMYLDHQGGRSASSEQHRDSSRMKTSNWQRLRDVFDFEHLSKVASSYGVKVVISEQRDAIPWRYGHHVPTACVADAWSMISPFCKGLDMASAASWAEHEHNRSKLLLLNQSSASAFAASSSSEPRNMSIFCVDEIKTELDFFFAWKQNPKRKLSSGWTTNVATNVSLLFAPIRGHSTVWDNCLRPMLKMSSDDDDKQEEKVLLDFRVAGAHFSTYNEFRSGSWLPTLDWFIPSKLTFEGARSAIKELVSRNGTYLAIHYRIEPDSLYTWKVQRNDTKVLMRAEQLAHDLGLGAVFVSNDPFSRGNKRRTSGSSNRPNFPVSRPWYTGASFFDKKVRTFVTSMYDRIIIEEATVALVWDPFSGVSSFSQKIYDFRCRRSKPASRSTFSYAMGSDRDEFTLEC